MNVSANPKTTVYVGGLDDSVNEAVLHAAFIPFGDIKDVNIPLDQTTQSNRGFGFITYLEKADAAAAMDNMHNSELYGRVLRVNFAQPMKIKGGEKGWSHQPVWADADTYMETQMEDQAEKVEAEDKMAEAVFKTGFQAKAPAGDGSIRDPHADPMAAAEAAMGQ
mmetsp:Transcript_44595/g.74412  ORF Transcript_44595/g.74412 Transcript_44595/m.74412 type:complete len:165 (+) Transcript_44595:285-779(+)|eukprot:CAMPEP_0198197552 /NCGR_PEP_ID=MMETSP1445-20131203/1133_1 /TAXON_ID=36898 /ORGANISM="Pyramimonas sp., Strain CCMP2087" /LENGTH=164 /DNA_ID=CAMNT_0043866865 /DNA_START=285 /DNA_END=779 /DNA_ORIENTATION=+